MKSKYRALARRRWGKSAEWIDGDGPFAVLAYCRVLTVSLWPTLDEAKQAKVRIDASGCGGMCNNMHRIVNLAAT